MAKRVDVRVENHGSLFLLRPSNKRGEEWLIEHTGEEAQFLGKALAVEPRFARDIVNGMLEDGLNVM